MKSAALLLGIVAQGLAAQTANVDTNASALVRSRGNAVVAVEVIETNSAAKNASGTGFFVTNDGLVLTNYHVVSHAIFEPERHAIEVAVNGGEPETGRVVAVDVRNDVALIATTIEPTVVLQIDDQLPNQGARLYAFGFPGDLGMSVVDGTYNGFLEHSFSDRMHFTGSLHPGMSGGPVLNDAGRVVGVNVATAGDVSFLIPSTAAAALLAEFNGTTTTPNDELIAQMGRQLHARQDAYVQRILSTEPETVMLDRYAVPTMPADFFDCWGDSWREDEERWEYIDHQCRDDDLLFVSNAYRGTTLQVFHRIVRTTELNRFRFYGLYTQSFQANSFTTNGDLDEVTKYQCQEDNMDIDGRVMKSVLCARKLRRFDGLYDVVFKYASLGDKKTGLETTLQMQAVSFDNAIKLADRFARLTTWTP